MANNNPYGNYPTGDGGNNYGPEGNSAEGSIYDNTYSYDANRTGQYEGFQHPDDPLYWPTRQDTGRSMIGEAVSFGFKTVFRRPLLFIGGTLLLFIAVILFDAFISIFLSVGANFSADEWNWTNAGTQIGTDVSNIISYILWLLLPPLFYNLALRTLRFRKVGAADLTTDMNFFPTVGAMLLVGLIKGIIAMPVLGLVLLPWAERAYSTPRNEWSASIDPTVWPAIAIVIFVILYFVLSVMLWAVPWIVADKRESVFEAISVSAKLGLKNFLPIVGFQIVMFLVNIAGIMPCFIGLLVTVPATLLATAFFYRGLIGGDVPEIK